MREYTSGPSCREAHDRGVVDTLRELLHSDLLDADGALSVLSAVVLDADGDVAADFAIDLQATQAHAGIDQPDWATPRTLTHYFVPARGGDPRTTCVECGSTRESGLHFAPDESPSWHRTRGGCSCDPCRRESARTNRWGICSDAFCSFPAVNAYGYCQPHLDAHASPARTPALCDICGQSVPCAHYGKES